MGLDKLDLAIIALYLIGITLSVCASESAIARCATTFWPDATFPGGPSRFRLSPPKPAP
jgi:hypothetical protein